MTPGRAWDLEELLSKTLPSVVVLRGQSDQLSLGDYRARLKRCREVYDPFIRPWLSRYRPEISNPELRRELLDFVNCELADYVRDGRIHSATIAFDSGLGSGSSVDDVAVNLIKRAIVDGPTVAAQAFIDCTVNSSCSFNRYFLLSGIQIEEPVEIFDGITLVPLPDSVEELPPYLPFIGGLSDRHNRVSVQDVVKKTLVQVECEVSPIFHRPAESYTFESGPDRHFEIRVKGEGAENCNLDTLCEALAVAGRCSVRSVMTWNSMSDYEIFDLSTMWGVGASGYSGWDPLPSRHDPSVLLNRRQLDTISTLYQGFDQPSADPWTRLHIPIDRLMKSLAESDPLDQIIDLGIALESLYVPSGYTGEVTLRFALHAAWHLGEDKAHRKDLRDKFIDIYRARSDVVHTGRLSKRTAKRIPDLQEFVRDTQDLCWQGITSIIDAGAMPDWGDLVMGENPEQMI